MTQEYRIFEMSDNGKFQRWFQCEGYQTLTAAEARINAYVNTRASPVMLVVFLVYQV